VSEVPSQASLDWLRRLVAHDTTSRNSNLALIAEVRAYLDSEGIASTLTHDETGTKANLDATIGPAETPGIALSGHTDVVPVDGQDWSSDPFTLAQRGDRLYGRGTCDMKGFLAACLAAVPTWRAATLTRPVHLCFSYDEEVGCVGVRTLLADFERRPVKPQAVIVGEPTGMQVVNGHKGKLSARAQVTGRACHSALAPQGVNALTAAARLAVFAADLAASKAREGPFDPDFDVPHSTVHCGVLESGTALNIVPAAARLELEIRSLPGEDPEALFAAIQDYGVRHLVPEMQAVAPEADITWERGAAFAGLDTDPDSAIVTLAKALAQQNDTAKVSFGTEAGMFARHGIPGIVCGPGHIAQAHKPDEFLETRQLARCEAFLARLTEHLLVA